MLVTAFMSADQPRTPHDITQIFQVVHSHAGWFTSYSSLSLSYNQPTWVYREVEMTLVSVSDC